MHKDCQEQSLPCTSGSNHLDRVRIQPSLMYKKEVHKGPPFLFMAEREGFEPSVRY